MSTMWAFDIIESLYEKVLYFIRERAKNIIDFQKEKMLPLTKEQLKSHQDASMLNLRKKNLKKLSKSINYRKFREHCRYTGKYRGAAHSISICNLKFSVTNQIPVVFHNGSNYDYHFMIKANEFHGQFECLGKNTEKYKKNYVPREKEVTNIVKDGNESVTTIC